MECTIFARVRDAGISLAQARSVVFFVLRRLGHEQGAVSLHFVGERRMRGYNRRYRGIDRPTDVLSFSGVGLEGDIEDLGDIFLCVPYLRRQAAREQVSYQEECMRMIIHGVLHVLGFDHVKPKEAAVMFKKQEHFLSEAMRL